MKKKLLSIILSMITTLTIIPSANAFTEPDWGALLRERESMVNKTDFELYTEGSVENAPYYGAKFEPRGGAYIGMLASGAADYKPLGSYLTYVESYWQNDLYAPDNGMVKNDNVITMVGWTVGDMNSVDYDGVRQVLEKLNSYGKPMLIRFANEMNVSSLGDNPEQYVNVFRNVANMIHEYPNLGVVWSPNDMGALDRPFELYYPGDEYVDWVGVSCYTTQYFLGNANTSYNDSIYFITGDYGFPTNKVKPIIKFMQDYGINKPVMISEGGVATNSAAEWNTPRMRNMMYGLIMKYPQIKMINYFNVRMNNESEWFDISAYQHLSDIFKEAASSGAYIRNYGDLPRFAFSKTDTGDTLIADADGLINLYTLAHIPQNPNVYVTYKLDGEWYHEAHELPYKCRFNVNNVTDGEHTLTIEGAGQSKTYSFIKRSDRIRFGGEPDMSKAANNSQSQNVDAAAETNPFKDVTSKHWANENIRKTAELGYFSGYEDGTFRPDNQITHEEFLKVIVDYGLSDKVKPVSDDYKSVVTDDVTNDKYWTNRWASWAQPYLNAAMTAGIVTKNDVDLAAVNTPITRGEMAKIISRLRAYYSKNDAANDLSSVITDWNSIPAEYKEYVAKAYNAGILSGYEDGTFRSGGNLTRAEASSVIMKLIDDNVTSGKIAEKPVEDNTSSTTSAPAAASSKPTAAPSAKNFKLICNEKPVDLQGEIVITDNDILLPIRILSDTLDITVSWDADTNTITYEKSGYGEYRIKLNNNVIEKRSKNKWSVCAENIEPARIINDKTVVPLFAIVKSLGMEINYDKDSNTAEINYADVKD